MIKHSEFQVFVTSDMTTRMAITATVPLSLNFFFPFISSLPLALSLHPVVTHLALFILGHFLGPKTTQTCAIIHQQDWLLIKKPKDLRRPVSSGPSLGFYSTHVLDLSCTLLSFSHFKNSQCPAQTQASPHRTS